MLSFMNEDTAQEGRTLEVHGGRKHVHAADYVSFTPRRKRRGTKRFPKNATSLVIQAHYHTGLCVRMFYSEEEGIR